MRKPILNYILIIAGVVLIVMNLYENQFHIDKKNIWRIISAICFITLGIYNLFIAKKNENRRI